VLDIASWIQRYSLPKFKDFFPTSTPISFNEKSTSKLANGQWEEMDRQIKKRKPSSLPALEEIAREVWREIPEEVLLRLVTQLPR
jgi:hypothetical protein